MDVVSGEIDAGKWQIHKDGLEKPALISIQRLAFSEISEITKKEDVAGYVYVEIVSKSGLISLAKMKSKVYMCLYEYWCIHQETMKTKAKVVDDARQLKSDAAWASKSSAISKVENVSFVGSKASATVVTKPNYNIVIIACLVLFFLFTANSEDDDNDKGVLSLASQQKESLCKQYIGSIMGRSPKVMYKYQTGDNYTAYIQYQRDDGEYWTYACSFTKDSIVWAGWLNDDSKWGRVMLEDEAKLIYNKPNQIVTIEGHGGLSF